MLYPPPRTLRARYLFPVAGEPLLGGTITIADGRITAIGGPPEAPVTGLGNVAILPGLVNAHTHLEFSDLAAPLGSPGMRLPDWIRLVIANRHQRSAPIEQAILQGLRESEQHGVTAIGEIATSAWPTVDQPQADVTVFRESIGLAPAGVAERLAIAATHLKSDLPSAIRRGLSPHAPYSLHADLFAGLLALAKQSAAPVAMHLAESREELEWLATGTGPFHELLSELGVLQPDTCPFGLCPFDFLQALTALPRTLVIHGNYLTAGELALLADHRETMSLVYCPRTHAYFEHEGYPLDLLLRLGVQVALGTDSRASNPDLSLLAEIRHVAHHHPQVRPHTVLELGTLAGAQALGIAPAAGSLEVGKWANLTIVPLADHSPADPHELLLDSTLPVATTYYRGRELGAIAGSS